PEIERRSVRKTTLDLAFYVNLITLAIHSAGFRPALERAHRLPHGAGQDRVVRIQPCHYLASSHREALVDGVRLASILLGYPGETVRVLSHHVSGIIGRRAVDNQIFDP